MVKEDPTNRVITKQTSPNQLPDNVETLREMVLTLLSDVDDKSLRMLDLESQLAWFKRHTFGRRSEKYPIDHPVLFDLLTQQAKQEDLPAEEKESDQADEPKPSNRNGDIT